MAKHFENTTSQSTYNGLLINTNKDKGLACYTTILDRYQAHLQDMLYKHSKVLQVRFDLRYPTYEDIIPQRDHISNFQYNFKRKLEREQSSGGHLVDPRLIMVEEVHDSYHPHYHVILLVNGNAKQRYYPLVQEAEHQWKLALKTDHQGLVDFCDRQGANGMMMVRNSSDYQEQVQRCSHQASYLAKPRGKDQRLKGSWTLLGTRVPKDISYNIYPW